MNVPIPQAIDALRQKKMILVVDNENRENQADVIFPAVHATEQHINFLLQHCHGMVCAPMDQFVAARLHLPLMVDPIQNSESTGVNFTVTIDAKDVKDFGISAHDRAKTIRLLANEESTASDFVRPGHVFPLVAASGGLLERKGHTEATVALCLASGCGPCGVLCEVLDERGNVRKGASLHAFAKQHNLLMITIDDLISYLNNHPLPQTKRIPSVIHTSHSSLPTKYGTFDIYIFRSTKDNKEHIALTMGDIHTTSPITRIHSACFTGDICFSLRCDCGEQWKKSMEYIAKRGSGILLYLQQEGRSIGLSHKIASYRLQEKGMDTVEANEALGFPPDARDYEIAADMLSFLGVDSIRLLTNNPEKIRQLKNFHISIIERISLQIPSNIFNKAYLQTKRGKLGHLLSDL